MARWICSGRRSTCRQAWEIVRRSYPPGTAAFHRYAAIASDKLRRYGFQFHPEVDDTVHGHEMIANFVLGICGCAPSWTMERYLEEQVERVRAQVGDRSVFLLASGGVDSTVAARLFGLAIGPDRLHLLHVDNGLMRKDESRSVLDVFREFGLDRNLHFVDAGVDTGDIIDMRPVVLLGGDTPERVYRRMARASTEMLAQHLAGLLDGTASRTPQDPARRGRLTTKDGWAAWYEMERLGAGHA